MILELKMNLTFNLQEKVEALFSQGHQPDSLLHKLSEVGSPRH